MLATPRDTRPLNEFTVRHAYAYYEILPEEFFGGDFSVGRFVHIEKSDNEGLGWHTLVFGTVKSIENGVALVIGDDGEKVTVDKTMHVRTHVEMPKYCKVSDLRPGQWFRIAQPHDLKRYPPSLKDSFYARGKNAHTVYMVCEPKKFYAYPIVQPAFDIMVAESPMSRFSVTFFQVYPQGSASTFFTDTHIILLRGPTYG